MAYQDYRKKTFSKGDIIIKQGDKSDEIYVILKGNVECLEKDSKGNDYIIEILSDGDVFGELDVVFGSIRQFTIRAKTDLEVVIVDPRLFSKLFDTELNIYISPIIQTYAKRIREYENELSELKASKPEDILKAEEEFIVKSKLPGDYRIFLEADSNRSLIAMHGEKSIKITKFPYRIGRYSRRRSDLLFHKNDLYLHDKYPYNVSRSHFSIEHKKGGYYFQDFGSWHGSEVNGKKFVNPGKKNLILLKIGENKIRLGNKDAKLKFKIIIK